MRVTVNHLRRIVREALEQDLRGNLDPKPGQMNALMSHDPVNDYLLWARTNGQHPAGSSGVASYAIEKSLDPESVEIKLISNGLKLGSDAVSDIKRDMARQEHEQARNF